MDLEYLPFSKPSITSKEIEAVISVLNSGWITTGPKNQELEEQVAQHLGAKHAVALCSATAALHVTLLALGIGPGDEVITPSLTWVSTANIITLIGATPVFVDVDQNTLLVDVSSIAEKITSKTRVVIPVHYAGVPCDLDALRELCQQRGLFLLEDAAHAINTTYKDNYIGSKGTAIFSFHAIKNLTSAEGGMLVTEDAALAERVKRLKFHGLGMDAYDRHTHARKPQAQVLEPGFKYNLTDIQAAIALVQLSRLESMNAQRTLLANTYLEQLKKLPVSPLSFPTDYAFGHAWHLFILRIDPERCGLTRDQFMESLKAHNIGTGIHFIATHLHKFYRSKFPDLTLPNSEWNSARLCSLPLFPDMELADVSRVVQAIESVLLST